VGEQAFGLQDDYVGRRVTERTLGRRGMACILRETRGTNPRFSPQVEMSA
jgi:hypothetical protein